jgi:hypothetical protein
MNNNTTYLAIVLAALDPTLEPNLFSAWGIEVGILPIGQQPPERYLFRPISREWND